MASLRNGHTAFDDEWLWQTHGACLGLSVRKIADGWIILKSAHPNIPEGAHIAEIDGRPIEEFVRSKLPFLSASSDRAAETNLFRRPYLFPESFTLRLSDGACVLLQRGEYPLPGRSLMPTLAYVTPAGVPVLRIPSFEDCASEIAAINFVDELQQESALIIDLRGNGGGNTPLRLLARLMDRPYRTWAAMSPRHTALNFAKGTPEEPMVFPTESVEPGAPHFKGRLIVIADRETASAAEDFLMPFKDNGRATIVGETTAGSSGQPFFKNLGDGMRLWTGAKRQVFPNGVPFEGIGIEADFAVHLTSSELRAKDDVMLRHAVEFARFSDP
jgi:carboxyl-terminal processing protease